MIIRTSGRERFDLSKDEMTERAEFAGVYFLRRKDLKEALNGNQRVVPYSRHGSGVDNMRGWIEHGITQRHKKYISIGCMRFVGENRTKLIRWAKTGK